MSKKGFTLAEVLITLGVIGVVAAMTMPTVIRKYQQHVVINQLKKVYTELNQAIHYSEAEFGEIENWDFNSNMNSIDFFNKYLSKFIKVKQDKIGTTTYYRLSGNIENNYAPVDGSNYNITTNAGYKIMMANSKVRDGLVFSIDINGDKKPNVFGKDVFVFALLKSSKTIIPFAWNDGNSNNLITDRNTLKNGDGTVYQYHCNKSGRGMWCAALIIQDGWKIDYPW